MGKPAPKPAKPAAEPHAAPDVTVVDKKPHAKPAPKTPEAGASRTTKTDSLRHLHPPRVWPD
jgi:hypothetical protein